MAEKHGNNWRTNFRLDGKRVRVPLGSLDDLTKDEADAAEALVKERMEQEHAAGGQVPLSRVGIYSKDAPREARERWDTLLSRVEADVALQVGTSALHAVIDKREIKFAPIISDRTGQTGYRFYNCIALALVEWASAHKREIPDVTEVDKHILLSFYEFVAGTHGGRSGKTIKSATAWRNYVAPLHAAIRDLGYDRDVEVQVIDTKWIMHKIKRVNPSFTTKDAKIGKFVDKKAFEAFSAHAKDVIVDLSLFLALTGMRKANGVSARWDELVSDDAGNIFLRKEVKSTIDRATGKRTKVLDIVIPPRAMAVVEKYRGKHSEFIWVAPNGGPLGYQNFNNRFFDAQAKLPKGDRFRIHDLRHTFTTRIGSRLGGEKAQNAVGHEDISTTRRYMHRDEGFHGAITSAIDDLWESEAA